MIYSPVFIVNAFVDQKLYQHKSPIGDGYRYPKWKYYLKALFATGGDTLMTSVPSTIPLETAKKKFSWNNIGIGAAIQVFEVSTLGQPFEVVKTHMAGKNELCFVRF